VVAQWRAAVVYTCDDASRHSGVQNVAREMTVIFLSKGLTFQTYSLFMAYKSVFGHKDNLYQQQHFLLTS
jgi:hypothetical protein